MWFFPHLSHILFNQVFFYFLFFCVCENKQLKLAKHLLFIYLFDGFPLLLMI